VTLRMTAAGTVQHQGRPGGPWIDYAITDANGGPLDGHIHEVIYDDPAGAGIPDTPTSYIGTDGMRHDVVDEADVVALWAAQDPPVTYPAAPAAVSSAANPATTPSPPLTVAASTPAAAPAAETTTDTSS
jgi:hypothetical protein